MLVTDFRFTLLLTPIFSADITITIAINIGHFLPCLH